MMTDRCVLTAAAISLACMVGAQDGVLGKRSYPEDLRQDFAVLQRTIEQSHPDPYRYHAKAEMDLLFQAVDTDLVEPLTAEGFIQAVLPILKAIGDANTYVSPPVAVSEVYEHSEPMLPLTVAVMDGRLFVDQELKGFRSLPRGSELKRINGRSATLVLALMRALLVPEGQDTTRLDGRIGRDFPELYRRAVGQADAFEIEYEAPDGSTGTKTLFAMTKDQMHQSLGRGGVDLQSWRLEELRAAKTGWLTLETLDGKRLKKEGVSPDKFLGSVASTLRKDDLSALVIDLRGAGGDDIGLAEQVFSLVAEAPYRCLRSMSVRSGNVPDSYKYAEPAPEFFAAIGSAFMPEMDGRMNLRADDPRLRMTPPSPKAFTGKVYVVSDGLTTDAAAALVMMAKRSHRCVTIGEETGSNAVSYCGGPALDITLPRTGCLFHMPLARYVPDGQADGPANRGEMPDLMVSRQQAGLVDGRDGVRAAIMGMIEGMR